MEEEGGKGGEEGGKGRKEREKEGGGVLGRGPAPAEGNLVFAPFP
jgi:hypothetical protein